MTKFLLFAALFVSTNIFGQKLDGFMDVKFGSSIDVVKKAMLTKPGCRIDLEKCDTNYLYFKGVIFEQLSFLNTGSKFYK